MRTKITLALGLELLQRMSLTLARRGLVAIRVLINKLLNALRFKQPDGSLRRLR